MTPQSYGKYQLLKKLATGGMAEVWLARQAGIEGFHKNVVIKRILPHLAEDREFVEMFRNEALIAARFNHPNIAQIYEFGEANGTYYIAMEFIHGEDLGRLMRKAHEARQWIAPALAIRIVASACEGLYYAHTRTDDQGRPLKVVHRDISPQNILISFDGSVKLVDFGIAKAADQASMTKSGAIKGKFAYMAPEQASGKPLDGRADIFAIGLVLYELLTGTRPLKRDNELATLQAALECNIEPPSLLVELPADLDDVVMRALAKAADDRYRDARQFQASLEEVLVEQRWVASSVQISQLMEALFAERLMEENKLGHPAPSSEDSSAHAAPAASEPPRPARSRSSQHSARAAPAAPPPPPADVPAWEAPAGRRTGELPRRGTGTEVGRTGSRTEMEPPPPRRTSTRGALPASRPALPQDEGDEATLGVESPAPPPPRRRASMASQGEPPRRTASRVQPQARVHEDEEESESQEVEDVTDERSSGGRAAKASRRPATGGRGLKPLLVAGVCLLIAGAAVVYREPLMRALTQSAADQNALFVTVTTNHRVKVSVRHTERCGMPGQVSELGEAPGLARSPGAHVGDTLLLENKQQGIREEIALPDGPAGTLHEVQREYKTGYVRLRLSPRNVPGLEVIRDGQVLGVHQEGLRLELAEGTHKLELHSPQLAQPTVLEVEVKAGATRDFPARLSVLGQ